MTAPRAYFGRRKAYYGTCVYKPCHNLFWATTTRKMYCSARCATNHQRGYEYLPTQACPFCNDLYVPRDERTWHCGTCKPWVDARTRQARVIATHAGHGDIKLVLWQLWQYNQVRSCEVCGITFDEGPRGKYVKHIDHCHTTGRIRGALCGRCNVILGYCDENWGVLSMLINYLISEKRSCTLPTQPNSETPATRLNG